MNFSFRNLHNAISSAYHCTFSDPDLYNLIYEADKLTTTDFIKIVAIKDVNDLIKNNNDILHKINSIENNSVNVFLNIIKNIITKNESKYNNTTKQNLDLLDLSLLNGHMNFIGCYFIRYYLVGFFYENYLDKYNKIINKLKIINEDLNDTTSKEKEKNEIYITLITDFIVELIAKLCDDIVFTPLKNNFNLHCNFNVNNKIPFKKINASLNQSKELLQSHNEKMKIFYTF